MATTLAPQQNPTQQLFSQQNMQELVNRIKQSDPMIGKILEFFEQNNISLREDSSNRPSLGEAHSSSQVAQQAAAQVQAAKPAANNLPPLPK